MSNSEQIVFFIDRCLGSKQVPESLRELGISVECHDDHFPKEAQDTEWMPEVGRQGWIVLTKDARIGKRTLEKIAVTRAGIRMFVLVSQNLSGTEMAGAFQKAIESMQKFTRENPAPFIAKVYRNGRVEEWKNHLALQAEVKEFPTP
jgi:predicted nuclease of predicted toxin-antitoxin system